MKGTVYLILLQRAPNLGVVSLISYGVPRFNTLTSSAKCDADFSLISFGIFHGSRVYRGP